MFVSQLWVNIPPLNRIKVSLTDGLNIVRGRNGAGKTILLEAIALFGHVPILRCNDPTPQTNWDESCVIQVTFKLSSQDVSFLIDSFLAQEMTGDALFLGPLTQSLLSNGRLSELRDWLKVESQSGPALGERKFLLGFRSVASRRTPRNRPELKLALADESKLASEWECVAEDRVTWTLAATLLSFSRPERISSSPSNTECWTTPARIRELRRRRGGFEDRSWHMPGLVSYLNTDMYEYGIGLDVRESPKKLDEDMATVVAHRLQLLALPVSTDTDLSLPIPPGSFTVLAWQTVRNEWSSIFKESLRSQSRDTTDEEDIRALVNFTLTVSPDNSEEAWELRIGDDSRIFLSSGENQALFLLLTTVCLEARGSCVVLDEPELHLSLGVTWNIFRYLLAQSQALQTQFVVSTHAPFVFARDVSENRVNLLVLLDGERVVSGRTALARLRRVNGRYVNLLLDDIRVDTAGQSPFKQWFAPDIPGDA
jgi:AAA domain, putative AbiEii toxin, Type IV TA system